MQLEEFYDYKNQLMHDILTNEKIVKLISDDATLENAKDLAYKQVFPCEYIPATVQEGLTYVCFDVDIRKVEEYSKTYLQAIIYVWVMAHRDRLRLPNGGGVRTDALCNEICKVINGSRYYGLGELDLRQVQRFAPVTDYNGKAMTFYATDFNRLYDGKKPVPSNRKSG